MQYNEGDDTMSYEICKRCGKMFEKNGKTYCKTCYEKNEKELNLIVDYIREKPASTVLDIITETGVSLKSINCLVEDGGVSYVENKLKIEEKGEKSTGNKANSINRNKFHLRR